MRIKVLILLYIFQEIYMIHVQCIRMANCLLYWINCKIHGGKTRTSENAQLPFFFLYFIKKKFRRSIRHRFLDLLFFFKMIYVDMKLLTRSWRNFIYRSCSWKGTVSHKIPISDASIVHNTTPFNIHMILIYQISRVIVFLTSQCTSITIFPLHGV